MEGQFFFLKVEEAQASPSHRDSATAMAMPMGTAYVTLPAFAAAFGIYLFDRTHSKAEGFRGVAPVPIGSVLPKARKVVNNIRLPKLAPQFDGLNCFETLVGH